MTDDDKSLLKDVLRQPGWELIERMNQAQVDAYRQLATAKGTSREDREWYSALALGREELLAEIKEKCNTESTSK